MRERECGRGSAEVLPNRRKVVSVEEEETVAGESEGGRRVADHGSEGGEGSKNGEANRKKGTESPRTRGSKKKIDEEP